MPIILSHKVAERLPILVWMDGRKQDLKLGMIVDEFFQGYILFCGAANCRSCLSSIQPLCTRETRRRCGETAVLCQLCDLFSRDDKLVSLTLQA